MKEWLHNSMNDIPQDAETLWDAFRKKHVTATPEEWVRQSALRELVLDCGYPTESIAVERAFKIGDLTKRFDIAVFHQGQLFLVIECKADSIGLSEKVSDQWMRYNRSLHAPYGAITNGREWKVFQADGSRVANLPEFGNFAL